MPKSLAVSLSAILTATAVVLSIYPGSIPVGPTKVLPYQHMVNGIAGILLGPWYAASIAFAAAILRIGLGVGTVFAFPGGIPGALVVGLIYHYVKKTELSALCEPIGTGIGALISAWMVQPLLGLGPIPPLFGLTAQWQLFLVLFWLSSIPGAIIGFVIIVALRKRGVIQRISI